MKKFIAAIVLASALSAPAFAESTEHSIKVEEMRRMFYQMTDQMMEDQMNIMKMQVASLTNYQRLLRQMMENDQGGDNSQSK